MKRYFQYFTSFTILFTFLILYSPIVNAGTSDSSNTSNGPATPVEVPTDSSGDIDAPIDGGITLLLAAGIGYGVKKHRENRKKKIV